MVTKGPAMHVAINRRQRTNQAGITVEYRTALIRRTYRENGKVKHETLGNVSYLPQHALDALKASLAGKTLIDATGNLHIHRSLPAGHIHAITTLAQGLGFENLLGKKCRHRDLIMGLLAARICNPTSKNATLNWFNDTTYGTDLGPTTSDELYAAMDWLLEQQPRIEKQLARTYLGNQNTNPQKLALFDLSSSWVTGTCNPLAQYGYSRDKKRGHTQIEYGMLATHTGLPIAVRVFPGNTADPTAFIKITEDIQDLAGVQDLVMVGDRGMITNARIKDLRTNSSLSWVTALRNTDIQALAEDNGPLQMSLFDEQNLAEISHPKYPGERLIACRNPALAEHRKHKRENLLSATEEKLDALAASVAAGRITGAGTIGVKVGKVLGKYNMAKHYVLTITDTSFAYHSNQESIAREAGLDGVYVIRTNLPATSMDAAHTVRTYKSLANVEKIFKTLKTRDLGIRPIRHYTEDRTRGHVFLCMLAAHLTWHLRTALAELTYTDEAKSAAQDPVAKAERSPAAARKASTRKLADQSPAYSFQDLLTHLATRTRNTVAVDGVTETFELLAMPITTQHRVLELITEHLEKLKSTPK
ncbi:IS1634 family transposase [Glutamicibacter uratoxydans]|uniref:IS1634 family transposase n=1 Tax=Glutamicibacter uratoxydans TaxID=43667 RepID=UPI003D6E72D2